MRNIKHLLTVFCLVMLAATLVCCKSTSVVPPATTDTTITKTVTETQRDTVWQTEKDSSYYRAYLECVNNKVVFNPNKGVETQKGNHLLPPKVNIKDNVLEVDCIAEAQNLFFQWKEKYIAENKATIQKIPYPVPAELSWWQTTQIWAGRVLFSLLLLIAIVMGLRATKFI